MNTAGANFVVADQRTTATQQWICFRPDAAMVAGTSPDAKLIRWRRDRPLRNQVANQLSALGKGNVCMRVEGACARNRVVPIDLPAHANLTVDANLSMAMPMQQLTLHTIDTHQFDYTLKALYEYGNCQYQFAADAQPTKVLPNLVPVRDSSAIPIV